MHLRKFILFIILDLAVLFFLLLLLAYHGWSHIFMLVIGVVFLALCLYDLRSGNLSAVLAAFFNLPDRAGESRANWLPAALSLVLIVYGLSLLFEHGLVNTAQRWAMQRGLFAPFALWSAAGTALVTAAAVLAAWVSARKR